MKRVPDDSTSSCRNAGMRCARSCSRRSAHPWLCSGPERMTTGGKFGMYHCMVGRPSAGSSANTAPLRSRSRVEIAAWVKRDVTITSGPFYEPIILIIFSSTILTAVFPFTVRRLKCARVVSGLFFQRGLLLFARGAAEFLSAHLGDFTHDGPIFL